MVPRGGPNDTTWAILMIAVIQLVAVLAPELRGLVDAQVLAILNARQVELLRVGLPTWADFVQELNLQ